jgi:hypothetical protein
LDDTAWDHVVEQHIELNGYLENIMATIQAPEHREPDPRAGRERYFRRGGPLAWIRVVTELGVDIDRVVTAFPQLNDPRAQGWRT